MKSIRTLIIHVPNIQPKRALHRIRWIAMGVFAIADLLSRNKFYVRILNLAVELEKDPKFDLIEFIKKHDFNLIAFSVHWAAQFYDTINFAKRVKENLPSVKILLGGMTVSYYGKQVLEDFPEIDFLIKGDGEIPALNLVKELSKEHSNLEKIPNLIYRQNNRIIKNDSSYVASETDLNKLCFSNIKLLYNSDDYLKILPTLEKEATSKNNMFLLCTGRGCPFNCTICGGSAPAQCVINERKKYIYRDPKKALEDIKESTKNGINNIYTSFDPEPNGPYYFELFDLIRKSKLDLAFYFGSWAIPTRQFIDVFKQTFKRGAIDISPETANESLRKKNKDPRLFYTNDELEKIIEYTVDDDFNCHVYFGYILPGDTTEDIRETLKYMETLKNKFSADTIYLPYSSDPGTIIQQNPNKFDVKYSTDTPLLLYNKIGQCNARRALADLTFYLPNNKPNKEIFIQSSLEPVYRGLKTSYPQTTAIINKELGIEKTVDTIEERILRPHYLKCYQDNFDGNISLIDDAEIFSPHQYYDIATDLLDTIPDTYFRERDNKGDFINCGEMPLIARLAGL